VLTRALRVLNALDADTTTLTLNELARRAGLPTSTASRLVLQMVDLGLLRRDERGRIGIGIRLWELASRAAPTRSLRETALPFMEDLHAVLGHHVQLGVREAVEVLFVERLSSPHAVINYTRVAGRLPLHASSSGLVLLAHAPGAVLDEVIAGGLPGFTEHTITDPDRLRREVAEVRRRGYALNRGHLHTAAAGVAVPIHGADGRVVAALSAIIPNDERAFHAVPALTTGAHGIHRALSGELLSR